MAAGGLLSPILVFSALLYLKVRSLAGLTPDPGRMWPRALGSVEF